MSPDSVPSKGFSLSFAGEDSPDLPIELASTSPCAVACPAGVAVKSYVTLISAGLFKEALEVVRRRNPLPGICGRVCTHPCEESCNRGGYDAPLAIRELKRFIADWEMQHPEEARTAPPERRFEERVAIVGSGPAGLTAANDLVRLGYGVTIFEALDRPGGMMVAGIPEFRLPRNVIETEIRAIEALGVEIRTNAPLGPDRTIRDLREEGYGAVLLAVGAHRGKKLRIPGEECATDAVEFLRRANLSGGGKAGDQVIVVGGGNSAIDAARTSLRLGSKEVTIVYRRTREEMPADAGEIEEAIEEGIDLRYLWSPLEVILEDGRPVGMKVIHNELGEPDESGRRRPVPVEGTETVIPCDAVIAAISQEPDLSFLGEEHGLALTRWNTFEVAPDTLMTNVPGLFAGGDAISGPASIIDAIRDGHRASLGIHCFLRGEPLPVSGARPERPGDREIARRADEVEKFDRIRARHADPDHRRKTFEEVQQAFTEEEAVAEASRCLHCGPCEECMLCVPVCDRKLFVTEDAEGEEVFVRLPMGTAAYEKAKAHLEAMLGERDGGDREPGRKVPLEPVTSFVLEEMCRGCGECAAVCEYEAPALVERAGGRLISTIDEALCRGCGTCAAICPSGAIVARHFTDDWVERRLREVLAGS